MMIEYDGSNLYGWQIQKKGRTVQGEIEDALKKIFKNNNINLIGAGRTDSGVHALGQIANVKIDTDMQSKKLVYFLLKNDFNAPLRPAVLLNILNDFVRLDIFIYIYII